MPGRMALSRWFDRTRSRCRAEKGQTMAEYAVVLGVIVPAILIAYGLLSDRVAAIIDSVRAFLS
jgi:Flp pilus assembly pilin Flp